MLNFSTSKYTCNLSCTYNESNPLDDKRKKCYGKPNMCLACKPIPKSMINDWVQDLKVKLCNIGVFLQDITISSSFLFRRTTRYCATKVIGTLAMNNDKGENYATFNIQ